MKAKPTDHDKTLATYSKESKTISHSVGDSRECGCEA